MKWRHGSDKNPLGHGRGRGVVVGVNCVNCVVGSVPIICAILISLCCFHVDCFINTSAHYITFAYF